MELEQSGALLESGTYEGEQTGAWGANPETRVAVELFAIFKTRVHVLQRAYLYLIN